MRLTYIFHSGFAIEAHNFTMIVDFYEDSLGANRGVVYDRLLTRPQRLYVLSTHSHYDHYNPAILEWSKDRDDIRYIFSSDIKSLVNQDLPNMVYLDKGAVFRDDIVSVSAFGSTDLGVSYRIETEKKTLFHAGDLNNWHWNQESTPQEIEEAQLAYSAELAYLAQTTPGLDVAMFPVDPRLGKDFMLGAQQFLQQIPTKLFVPMHFGVEHDKAAEIKEVAKKYCTKTFVPKYRGELYDMEIE